MQKLIVANWKMHALSLTPWKNFHALRNVQAVICPPFPYLKEVRQFISRHVAVGAQDVFWEEQGPYTGEISPAMVKDLGAEYVIVGHSERRKWLGESDVMINKKIKAAYYDGLKIILCVGEPKSIRKKGMAAAEKFIKDQLEKDLAPFKNFRVAAGHLVVAYEPIWAIGTSKADNPQETIRMAEFIRNRLPIAHYQLPVLYGGSVNGKNAKNFLQYKEIDGVLVGGASLKLKEFEKIVRAAVGGEK